MSFWKIFACLVAFSAVSNAYTDTRLVYLVSNNSLQERQGVFNSVTVYNKTSKDIKISWSFCVAAGVLFVFYSPVIHFEKQKSCPKCCPSNALYFSGNDRHIKYVCDKEFDAMVMDPGVGIVTFISSEESQYARMGYSIRDIPQQCKTDRYKRYQCLTTPDCYDTKDICDGKFDCLDHSDEINCLHCPTNHTLCNNHSTDITGHRVNHCFDPTIHRCDGIFQCPTGEDELGCSSIPGCENSVPCKNGQGCYTLLQRCNNVYECIDHSDEVGCIVKDCTIVQDQTPTIAVIVGVMSAMTLIKMMWNGIVARYVVRPVKKNVRTKNKSVQTCDDIPPSPRRALKPTRFSHCISLRPRLAIPVSADTPTKVPNLLPSPYMDMNGAYKFDTVVEIHKEPSQSNKRKILKSNISLSVTDSPITTVSQELEKSKVVQTDADLIKRYKTCELSL